MALGGKRPGAGRKKGSANKATAARQKEIAESGLTPIEYMMNVLRNDQETPERRMDAAKSAAPYVHPRLQSTEVSGKGGGPIEIVSKKQRDAAVTAALDADR